MIPTLTNSKCYKYLGYWINVDLDWSYQRKISQEKFIRDLDKIKRLRISAEQKTYVVNMTINSEIGYIMRLVPFSKSTISSFEKRINSTFRRQIGGNRSYNGKFFSLSLLNNGLNSTPLSWINKAQKIGTIIEYGLNNEKNSYEYISSSYRMMTFKRKDGDLQSFLNNKKIYH